MYQGIDYLINVVLGPREMYYTEIVLDILMALCYIIIVKWIISWCVSNLVGISSYITDWIGYVVVIVLTPTVLRHYLNYEITNLTIFVFVAYSIVFMIKQILRYSINNI